MSSIARKRPQIHPAYGIWKAEDERPACKGGPNLRLESDSYQYIKKIEKKF